MSKRKHDEDVHSDRKLRAAPAWDRDNRTVAQLATGSIGVHRVAYPRASLLGLPREIRDLIYSYISHEISCIPEDSQSCRIRQPRDAAPYTNDCPAPAMYEGVSIGSQMVDELAQLSGAKRWNYHPMFSVCRQVRKEYLDSFHQRNFQARRLHFLVRGFNFETVIQVIKKWRPPHVVIELSDDYYWQEGAVRHLRKWYQSCKTSSMTRLDEAEIDGHQFRLIYQRELRYHSPFFLARGRLRQVDMLRDILGARPALPLMAQTRSARITRQAIGRHVAEAIKWIDTYNGNKARVWKGEIKAAIRDVRIARKNGPISALKRTSKLLGRKRDFEDMEAGGRADPLDAKLRAMAKRWTTRRVPPTSTHYCAAETRAARKILGEGSYRPRLAEELDIATERMVGIQTQKDAEMDIVSGQLSKMGLKGSESERIDAVDEMEIEPKEMVGETDSWAMNLKIVIEQIAKLSLVG